MHAPGPPTLLRLLVEATALFKGELRAQLQVSTAQMNVMRYLDDDGTRIGELAERLGITRQSTSELVGTLATLGFVAVHTDPVDRRARHVVRTPAGREAIMRAAAIIAHIEGELDRQLGDGHCRRLGEQLELTRDALRPRMP